MPPAGTLKSSSLDLTRPGIIEASAGTGKTFAIAEIFLAILRGKKTFPHGGETGGDRGGGNGAENSAAPRVSELLVVTFTEAATAELRARLRKRIRDAKSESGLAESERLALSLADAEFDEASIFTIHGFCLRVLKEFGITPRAGEIISSPADELSRFAARWRARKIAAGEKIFFDVGVEEIRAVLNPFLQNPEIVPVRPKAEDERGNALFRAAEEALPEWRALRGNAENISYGELLLELRDALRETPGLAAKIAARFRVAVVDEFQDTDPVQWEIFRRIFAENARPIFCVGDPKQAIYEFRGGDVRTYRRARGEILRAGGGNALTLGENWRSEPETIAAFNELFSADAEISGELDVGAAKTPRKIRAALAGALEYAPVAFPRSKADALGAEELAARERRPAAVLRISAPAGAKDAAAAQIEKRLVADVADLVRNCGVPARDVAVLVCDNEEANRCRAALSAAGISAATTARGNVLCRPIASAFEDLLRAMLRPQDSALFRRAALSPFFAGTALRDFGSEENRRETDAAREAFAEARERWTREGFLPAFRALSERLRLMENISALPQAKTLSTDVAHLAELLHAKERRTGTSPRALADAFGAMIASADPADDADELQLRADDDGDAVRILTAHKSKGLEFEVVLVPSLWKKSLISSKPPAFTKCAGENGETRLLFDAAATKKEKSDAFLRAAAENACANAACLFYVALTRARRRLVVYHAPQIPKGALWNSYQKLIFEAAGVFSENAEKALPHWKIIGADEPLPEEAFPRRNADAATAARARNAPDGVRLLAPEEARRRFARAENALKRIARDAEGVFSFSRIIRDSESDETARREDDESPNAPGGEEEFPADDAEESAGTRAEDRGESFPRTRFFDLPAGPEFGTIVHLAFEKTDFRSRENLPELSAALLPQLPEWSGAADAERKSMREKFSALVESNLALPLTDENFRLEDLGENDAVREMEFHFPLRRSRNLRAELFRIFESWGGVYAETARRHWSANPQGEKTALNVGGMMTGVIDLAFRANGHCFILDWKTNAVAPRSVPADFRLPRAAVREEIIKHGYALQWAIYAVALKKFLERSLGGNFDWNRDFGGVIYLFVRWNAPFVETETLTAKRLAELEEILNG